MIASWPQEIVQHICGRDDPDVSVLANAMDQEVQKWQAALQKPYRHGGFGWLTDRDAD